MQKTRSRGGCARCKKRKVRCDRFGLGCRRCRKDGVECPGYQLPPLSWCTKYEASFTETLEAIGQSAVQHTRTPISQAAVPLNNNIPESRPATNETGAETVEHLQQEWTEQTPVADPFIATSASSDTRLPARDTLQHTLHTSTLGCISLQPPTSTPSQAQFRALFYTPSSQIRKRRTSEQVERKYISLQSHGEKRTAKYTRRRTCQHRKPGFQAINHSDRDEPATFVPGSDTRNRSESWPSGFQDTVNAPQGNRAPEGSSHTATTSEQDSNLTELSVDAGTRSTFFSVVMNNIPVAGTKGPTRGMGIPPSLSSPPIYQRQTTPPNKH
ncbi:hypothetical protein QBC37DRAFT_407140 [Rhypophila decipiens]|uniref:Zn(2)-C6 fungal-type domain-containing protein n=1 Tax=Rhypophila decipiens TaxID=261697 RepID=A0AAN6XVE2_9PEZI|nr:hypothetical protein QBC37DRAFT_407140 [Rhypophila decipiens]